MRAGLFDGEEGAVALLRTEEIGGDFKTYVIQENTGKPGSLKKNYGSWKVKRKLREITPLDKK